jgi:hypothetical protein
MVGAYSLTSWPGKKKEKKKEEEPGVPNIPFNVPPITRKPPTRPHYRNPTTSQ